MRATTALPLFLLKPVKSLSPAVRTGHDPPSSWPKVQVAALEGVATRVVMPSTLTALSPRTMERFRVNMKVLKSC